MRPACLAVVLLLCGAGASGEPLQQQPPPRPPLPTPRPGLPPDTLHGRILPPPGEHGLPLSATVTLVSDRGSPLKTVVPQGNSFSFTVPGPGSYVVRVASAGYQVSELEVVAVDGPVFVTVQMGARIESGEPVTPEGPATVSVSALAVPEEAREELERANRASAENDPDRALRHLEKALEIHPDFAEAYNNLAVQYLRLGRPDEARGALRKAIELEPDSATAHRNLGFLFLGEKKFAEAQPELERAHELDPTDFKTANFLAELYFKARDYDRALPVFETVYRIDPLFHEALLQIGNCHLARHRAAESILAYETFLERVPDDPRAPQVRALVQRLRRR